MNSLVIALLIKASLLIGVAFAVNRLVLRRRSAASRHLVWTLALTAVLLLPVLSIAVPGWEIPIRVAAVASAPVTTPATMAEAEAATMTAAARTPIEPSQEPAVESATATTNASPPSAALLGQLPWTRVALAIYTLGVLVLGLRLAIDRWTLRSLVRQSTEVRDPEWRDLLRECELRMGIQQPVRLLRSLDRSMPMAFGLRTPTILIPAIADTWSGDRRRAVLLHELAHIDRRDCFTQLLAVAACAGYWMHPGVWWVARRLRVERELACDDRVLSAGTVARDYAAHLLELAYSLGGYRSPALVVSMARPRQLEGRMLAVLDAARNRVTPTLRARVVGLVATAVIVLPLAAAEAVVVSAPAEAPRKTEWTVVDAAVYPRPAPVAPELGTVPPQTSTRTLPPPPPPPPIPREDIKDRRRDIELPGTWEVRSSDDANRVYLRLSERPNSMHGFTLALDQLDGLSSDLLAGSGGPAKFSLKREAGTLVFDGVFRSGVGAGTFDFTPDPAFPAGMVKRGFDSPTKTEQYQLARGNVGFAFLDELNAQKYERPSLVDLVRAADHGVNLEYLRGMGSAGYRLGRIDALVRTRDHGVTPEYVRAMSDEGFKNLTADELVRAKDHGVGPEYVKVMRAFGYGELSLDKLIRSKDHGVSADYVRAMMGLWPERLSLDELVRAKDHGATPEYVKAMRDAGYAGTSLDELIRAKDHGVGADYVRGMIALGGVRPALEELVEARDHGVGPEFIKAWRDLGYKEGLAEMIKARDHGVGPEFAKELSAIGYERLSLSELVRLRDHGVSAAFAREQNSNSRNRLTVEELVRRRDGRM